ncbi:MAG: hypothetical protein HY286_19215 [Planctomycetes bacterium]|nr:hypothetical protein [Planctomycetota bacterium]
MALAWAFPDETTDHTNAVLRAARDTRAIVPSLWFHEISKGLVTATEKELD